ncbi:hypothetical protein Droror1_Dr00005164 [Drosera rotundifolia]
MRKQKRLFSVVQFVIIATIIMEHLGIGQRSGVEARNCSLKSPTFKADCMSTSPKQNQNCYFSCKFDGFSGGHCEVAVNNCMCTYDCSCSLRSPTFQADCMSPKQSQNCYFSCKFEGFSGGYCEVAVNYCMCTHDCP